MAVTAAVVFGLGMWVVLSLPSQYTAKAGILIESKDMFSADNADGIKNELQHRVHAIIKTTMTNKNIGALLERHELLSSDASDKDKYVAIERFREHAVMEFDNVPVINRYTGREGSYALGLNIHYSHSSADIAHAVVDSLTKQLLSSNSGKLSGENQQRLSYLQASLKKSTQDLSQTEAALAAFKKENVMMLPEVQKLAVKRHEDLQSQLVQLERNLEQDIRREDETLVDLATSSRDALLYSADGTRVLGAAERLVMLETEYAEKVAKYTRDHPEIVRLGKEISGLKAHVNTQDTSDLEISLSQAKAKLAAASKRYTDVHPEVKSLRGKIIRLQKQIGKAQSSNRPRATSAPSNPGYNRLVTRLEGIRTKISQETIRQQEITAELAGIQSQIQKFPQVEQGLDGLERAKNFASNKYASIEEELLELELSKGMREANLLDRFLLVEPPEKPLLASKPNKKLLLAVLSLLALSTAYLAGLLIYWYRDKIHEVDELRRMIGAPTYVIPVFK